MTDPRFIRKARRTLEFYKEKIGQLAPHDYADFAPHLDNLYKTLEYTIKIDELVDLSAETMLDFHDLLDVGGDLENWLRLLSVTKQKCRDELSIRLHSEQVGFLGKIEQHKTAFELSLALLERCRVANIQPRYRARALINCAAAHIQFSQEKANEILTTAEKFLDKSHSLEWGYVYFVRSNVAFASGHKKRRLKYLKLAIEQFQNETNQNHLFLAKSSAAEAHLALGDNEACIHLCNEVEDYFSSTNSPFYIYPIQNRSLAYRQDGKTVKAFNELMALLNQRQAQPISPYVRVRILTNIGYMCYEVGRLEFAEQYLIECLRMFEYVQNDPLLANVYGSLGDVFVAKGEYENAISNFDMALKILGPRPPTAWGQRLKKSFFQKKQELVSI